MHHVSQIRCDHIGFVAGEKYERHAARLQQVGHLELRGTPAQVQVYYRMRRDLRFEQVPRRRLALTWAEHLSTRIPQRPRGIAGDEIVVLHDENPTAGQVRGSSHVEYYSRDNYRLQRAGIQAALVAIERVSRGVTYAARAGSGGFPTEEAEAQVIIFEDNQRQHEDHLARLLGAQG